jgi:hypothetical protein
VSHLHDDLMFDLNGPQRLQAQRSALMGQGLIRVASDKIVIAAAGYIRIFTRTSLSLEEIIVVKVYHTARAPRRTTPSSMSMSLVFICGIVSVHVPLWLFISFCRVNGCAQKPVVGMAVCSFSRINHRVLRKQAIKMPC